MVYGKCVRVARNWWAFVRARHGGSAAEFALILVPMVFIFVLMIQFGVLLFVHNDMFNAARDVAREMSLQDTANATLNQTITCDGSQINGNIEDIACDHLVLWSGMTTFDVRMDVADDDPCDEIRVTVSTPMDQAAPFNIFGILSIGNRDLVANMVIRSQKDLVDSSGDPGSGTFCLIGT